MIVIIIKDNQWTTTNNNTEPWTMNRETWTMHHEPWTMNIFSVMVVLPLTFFIFFIFLRRRSYPSSLHLSILWSSPGGEELLVVTVPHEWTTTETLLNNNTEPWTFFSVMVVLPLIFFIFIFWEEGLTLLRFICQSSGLHQVEGPPGLHRGGRACPKITARCWEIVSVGQLLVRQFQWEMLGLTLTIFDWTIYDF